MRALLVANPAASTTSARTREVIARALGSGMKVEVVETAHRGHAAALACRAARDGVELVVAVGGDGTVNEVVNGLLTDGPRPDLPALAVVPGGSTNVFARIIGLPEAPVEATGVILEALRLGRGRRIGLGRADGRWFTFAAGVGFDADVIHRMERRRRAGRPVSHRRYAWLALTHFLTRADRRRPALTLERPGEEPVPGVYFALVTNASPWTYLGGRPLTPTPGATFETGLDVFAPRTMSTLPMLRYVGQTFRRGVEPRGRKLVRLHDVGEFTLRADRPVALQVDGDYLDQREVVTFSAVPGVLRVIV